MGIFVKFGVIIFIIARNFFCGHTGFWPIKCDYEIIHTKFWQILKSLANLKKIARGDFLYKFWTFRRSRIITQYLPKFGVDISHNYISGFSQSNKILHLREINALFLTGSVE